MAEGVEPSLLALVAAPQMVHFVHRWFAFVVLVIALGLYWSAWGSAQARDVRMAGAVLVLLIVFQIALGVSVVLLNVRTSLALLHQATGVTMFMAAVYLTHRLRVAELRSLSVRGLLHV
jgi:cytochrome c oxidase assembly protein subunit 15